MNCAIKGALTPTQKVLCYGTGIGIGACFPPLTYYGYDRYKQYRREKHWREIDNPSSITKCKKKFDDKFNEHRDNIIGTTFCFCGTIITGISSNIIYNDIKETRNFWKNNPQCCHLIRKGISSTFFCGVSSVFFGAGITCMYIGGLLIAEQRDCFEEFFRKLRKRK